MRKANKSLLLVVSIALIIMLSTTAVLLNVSASTKSVTFDFTAIDGFSSWTTSYIEHVVNYDEAKVTFKSADRQSGTITNMPVTKGQSVTCVVNGSKTITAVELVCKQWGSKAQTITLHTSTDGVNFTKTDITSKTFTLSAEDLGEDVVAVQFTFSSTSNQVGIQSLTLTYAEDESIGSCTHEWDDGVVTTEATCTENGVKTYTCANCGDTKTETIKALGHAWDDGVVTTEPTCTENGVKTYTCANCGETKTSSVASTGHSYVDGVCENCGEEQPPIEGTYASGKYYVTFTYNDVQYYLVKGTNQPTLTTDKEVATLLTVTLVAPETYEITDADGNYLYATNTNNGVRFGTTSSSWIYTEVDGVKYFQYNTTSFTRYLTPYVNNKVPQDMRSYQIGTAKTCPVVTLDLYVPELQKAVAYVDEVAYYDLDEAIAAAKGDLDKALVLVADMDYEIAVDSCITIALAEEAIGHKVTFTSTTLSYKTSATYDGDEYEAYAIYEKDYLFSEIANEINKLGLEGIGASYNGTSFAIIAKNAQSISDIVDSFITETLYDVMAQFIPLVAASDEITFEGVTIYNGIFDVDCLHSIFDLNMVTIETIANAESKTIASFNLTVKGGDTTINTVIDFTLGCSDSDFDSIRNSAKKALNYIEFGYVNGEFVVNADFTTLIDQIYANEIAENGIKAVRDEINAMTIKEFIDSLEGKVLVPEYAENQEMFDDLVKLVNKFADRLENTNYKSNLEATMATLDKDSDGIYNANPTFTKQITSLINKFKATVDEKYSDYADIIDIDAIILNKSFSVKANVTVSVFESYTATFVDADGNVIYTETLLEGEVPTFEAEDPTKEATTEYIYVFTGWTDGTNEYGKDEALAALTADTTYTPVFEEIPTESENEDLKFHHAAVVFESSLSIKFYAEKAILDTYNSFYAKVIFKGEEFIVYGEENGDYYQFVFSGIAAKEMTDELQIVLVGEKSVGGVVVTETSEELSYSIRTYALNMLNNSTTSDQFKTLLVDALSYGTYAQIYFDYNKSDLAIKGLTAEQFGYATQEKPALESNYSYTNRDGEVISFRGASLVFGNTINIKYIIDVSAYEGAIDDVVIKFSYVDANTSEVVEKIVSGVEFTENAAYYACELTGLSARDIRTVITAVICDAEGNELSGTLEYSMLTYIYNKSESGSDVSDLGIAAVKYGDSAQNYFGTVTK